MRRLYKLLLVFVLTVSVISIFDVKVKAETVSSTSIAVQDLVLSKSSLEITTSDSSKQLTRAELTRFLVNSLGLYDENATSNFKDVPANNEYYHDISSAVKAGIMNGVADGIFAPDNGVTRAQYAIVLTRALGYSFSANDTSSIVDVPPGNWYYQGVSFAVNNSLMKLYEDGTFKPNSYITLDTNRQLIAKVLPVNASNKRAIWKTSDPNIAVVDETGLVTGKVTGQVTITATTEDGTITKTCLVTVTDSNSNVNVKPPIVEKETDSKTEDTNKSNIYTVVSGDTLYKIALKNKITVETIIKENSLTSTMIYSGQILRIPTTYTVATGDTMYLISKKLDVELSDLISANPLIKNPSSIYIGQILDVPSKISQQTQSKTYLVKAGDTMYLIAQKLTVGLNELIKSNPQVKQPNAISVGQILFVPYK